MSDFTYPSASDSDYLPTSMELVQFHNQRASRSPLSGYVQGLELPGSAWGWVLGYGEQHYDARQKIEGFYAQLNGMEHRVALYDMGRPLPKGTINMSGVTASAASQFASQITLNGCGNTKTLLRGDWFSVVTASGTQLLMCAANATSDAGGVMSNVQVRFMLRAAVTGGATVTLDKPVGYFINANAQFSFPRSHGFRAAPVQLTVIEKFQA